MTEPFNERPHVNEKADALDYVKALLTAAQQEQRSRDVEKLEKLVRLLNTKKYGLVWEEHAELVEEEMKTKIPVFVEDEERKITGNPDSTDYNFLLEGDNLHSLHLLEKTHAGKIDVIYIDPPYNTGNNDFVYNDAFVDKTDGYSHSKWLSFMEKRLVIARELLSEEGVIFISIDDNEQAQLKLLCDEVFGEGNILSTHHIQVRYDNKSLNEKNNWQPVMEYIYIYAKNKFNFSANQPYEQYSLDKFLYSIKELTSGEEISLGGKNVKIFRKGEWEIEKHDRGSIFLLKETWASGSVLKGNTSGKFFDLHLSTRKEIDGLSCLYKVEGIGEDNLGYRYFTGPQKASSIRGKFYSGVPLNRLQELDEGGSKKYKPITNLYDFSADFGNIRHEGDVSFNSGKKPIKLLKMLINYHKRKIISVLDFFAGSGTTGHAVAQLNKEDGGNRKYILCTNNENNICEEVTYKRLANIQEELPHNLKYFKTEFVEKAAFPDFELEEELLHYVTPLVELEFGVDITDPRVEICLTEEHLADLVAQEALVDHATLFLRSDVLLDDVEQAYLQAHNITIIEIPDYYFGEELWS